MNIANNNNNKWATFTYHSPKVRMITNLFKQTDIKIAFKSTNTLQQPIKPKSQDTTQEHDKSGIYKITTPPSHIFVTLYTGRYWVTFGLIILERNAIN